MSEDTGGSPGGDDLQFDRAEFAEGGETTATAGTACAFCKRELEDSYFEVAGRVVCPGCKDAVVASFTGGSSLWRAFKAIAYGGLAGVVGAGLWMAVTAATGYSLGLISIAVGMGVGAAVRKGSQHRGGLFYQLLAVFLTYCAIVTTYVPIVYASLHGSASTEADAPTPPAKDPKPTASPAGAVPAPSTGPARVVASPPSSAPGLQSGSKGGADALPPSAGRDAPFQVEMSAVGLVIRLVISWIGAFALPFLIATSGDGLMHLLIIAFGLHEAWKANAKLELQLNGPFSLETRGPTPPPP